jgi:hypothetical protein
MHGQGLRAYIRRACNRYCWSTCSKLAARRPWML